MEEDSEKGAGDCPPRDGVALKNGPGNLEFHPLEVDLILKELFGNLPQEELAVCRLVNRQWHEESLQAWRETATLTFTKGKICVEKDDDDDDDGSSYTVSIKEFLQLWEASEFKPLFRQFHLEEWDAEANFNPFEVVGFWEQVGSRITTLTLISHKFSCLDEFRKTVYQLCPNMTYLYISGCVVQGTDFRNGEQELVYREPEYGHHRSLRTLLIYDSFPDSWMDMLSHFSSLTSITVEDLSDDQVLKLLLAVQLIKAENPEMLPLTHFGFVFELEEDREDIFQLVREAGVPLTDFFVYMDNERSLTNSFRDVLHDHSTTVTQLFVRYYGALPCPQFPYGVTLKALSKLEIYGIGFCNDLHFLRNTPNLTELRVTRRSDARGMEVFANTAERLMANVSLPKMRKLQLECTMTEEDLRRLQNWMPNVEVAALILDDGKFTVVCEHWRKLRGLFDLGRELTDQGLLGSGEEETLPNMTYLKCLKLFGTASELLTEVSVHSGFLKMPSLKAVAIKSQSPLIVNGGGRALRAEGIDVSFDTSQFLNNRFDDDDD